MNFIIGLVSLAAVVYLFLYFRPREKESLTVMALCCIAAVIHMCTAPSGWAAAVLTLFLAVMVVCCALGFSDEYKRRRKKSRVGRPPAGGEAGENKSRITA